MTRLTPAKIIVAGVLQPVLCILSFLLRIYFWRRNKSGREIDAIIAIPSVILVTAIGPVFIYGARVHLLGVLSLPTDSGDTDATRGHQLKELRVLAFAINSCVPISIALSKCSVLFFFRRLFKSQLYWSAFDVVNWTIISINIAWGIALTVAQFCACDSTIHPNWSAVADAHNSCVKPINVALAGIIVDLIVDVAIYLEPLLMISLLRLMDGSARRWLFFKYLIINTLLGVTVVRMVSLTHIYSAELSLQSSASVLNPKTKNIDALISHPLFWAFIEQGVACGMACLLPCRLNPFRNKTVDTEKLQPGPEERDQPEIADCPTPTIAIEEEVPGLDEAGR